jgi:hypothetical protein
MNARIQLTANGFLAELADGSRIEHADIPSLAAALYAAGVTVNTVFCGDWREGEHILMSGQQVALKVELRRLSRIDSP